jgi:hypothetical protein
MFAARARILMAIVVVAVLPARMRRHGDHGGAMPAW